MRRPFLLLLLALAGCTATSDRIVLNGGQVASGAALWQLEFTLKYHRVPVVIAVHGGGTDHWMFYPDKGMPVDADSFVAGVAASHPGRLILVASCNEKGFPLHVPGAWYPKNIIWSIPGRDRRCSGRTLRMETWVGNVDELVEGSR